MAIPEKTMGNHRDGSRGSVLFGNDIPISPAPYHRSRIVVKENLNEGQRFSGIN